MYEEVYIHEGICRHGCELKPRFMQAFARAMCSAPVQCSSASVPGYEPCVCEAFPFSYVSAKLSV